MSPARLPRRASIERLPGGALGSGTDTDDNAADFADRLVPEPQNFALRRPRPADRWRPRPAASVPTPGGRDAAIRRPPPAVTAIGDARALPDGTTATIEGVALASSDFHDGGGFVADATGGLAVLVTDGAFLRGAQVRVTGEIDDRFSQRTLRVDGPDVTILGAGSDPMPITTTTGGIGEALEGRLVRIDGVIARPTASSRPAWPSTSTTGAA